MFTGVCVGLGALTGTAIATWRARRAAARAEAGQAVHFAVGANRPQDGRKYSLGRVRSDRPFHWEPRWRWNRLRHLPDGLLVVQTREMTLKEMLWLPSGAVVLECSSDDGPVRLWVHRAQAEQVRSLVRRAWSAPEGNS
ncbi:MULTISPECIES: hypothetical protein [unclassified Streptomyces]|uniref:hypothetical protein n=1 Tax=unclassified Streptomyces TaxID=2593676 RepID=UPI00036C8C1B|nr:MULTISPECIES: hypothetical protein [unclassified Streptomyces]